MTVTRVNVSSPMQGDLQVYHFVNVPSQPDEYRVDTVDEARKLIDWLAKSDLQNPNVETNVFGLQEFVNRVWEEWEGPNGESIDDDLEEADH